MNVYSTMFLAFFMLLYLVPAKKKKMACITLSHHFIEETKAQSNSKIGWQSSSSGRVPASKWKAPS
jgi:hypothetical protein